MQGGLFGKKWGLGEMSVQKDFWVKIGVLGEMGMQRDFWVKIGFWGKWVCKGTCG